MLHLLQGDDQAVSGRTHEEYSQNFEWKCKRGRGGQYKGKAGKIVRGDTDGSMLFWMMMLLKMSVGLLGKKKK